MSVCDVELAARRERARRSPPSAPGPITRRLCWRLLNQGSGKFRKKRRTLPSANRRAMSTDMLANTLRTLVGPRRRARRVDRVDQLAPDLDADERGRRSSRARSIRKWASAAPSSTSSARPGSTSTRGTSAMSSRSDLSGLTCWRMRIAASASPDRPGACSRRRAARNTAAGAAAACAPASAASMTSVGMRIAAATTSVAHAVGPEQRDQLADHVVAVDAPGAPHRRRHVGRARARGRQRLLGAGARSRRRSRIRSAAQARTTSMPAVAGRQLDDDVGGDRRPVARLAQHAVAIVGAAATSTLTGPLATAQISRSRSRGRGPPARAASASSAALVVTPLVAFAATQAPISARIGAVHEELHDSRKS